MIKIKTLSFFQGNQQDNDHITDFQNILHNRHNNYSALVSPSPETNKKRKNKETDTTSCSCHHVLVTWIKRLRISDNKIQKQKTKTKNIPWYPPPVAPLPPHPNINQPPSPSPPPFPLPTITMDMAFLAQMRQSNKRGSVKNVEIISLHLGYGVGPWVSIPYPLQDTSHIYWFHPLKTINQEKEKNSEMRSNFQQIILHCLGLHTWCPGLTEVDLEPSPKRGIDEINMQKQGTNTQKKARHIVQPGLTHVDPST